MRAFEGDIWLSGGAGRCYLVKWGEGEGGGKSWGKMEMLFE